MLIIPNPANNRRNSANTKYVKNVLIKKMAGTIIVTAQKNNNGYFIFYNQQMHL